MSRLRGQRSRSGLVAACSAAAIAIAALVLTGHAVPAATTAGTITTFAGGGAPGDGGAPTLANFAPTSIAMDHSGALYITDTQNQRIRRISPGPDGVVGSVGTDAKLSDTDDTITTVAGDGQPCTTAGSKCGDGGPALSAALGFPEGVAVDAAGNVYISDSSTNSIRFVCEHSAACSVAGGVTVAPGAIATLAGNGTAGFRDGVATTAEFQGPTGIALDPAGNLFVADTHNQRVREICLQPAACTTYAGSIASGSVLTVAGTGLVLDSGDSGPGTSAGVELPMAVAVDGSDNVYVTTGGHDVRKVSAVASSGTVTTLASGDLICRSTDTLCFPRGISVGTVGSPSLYLADTFKDDVAKLDLTTSAVTMFAGSGTQGNSGDGGSAASADFGTPYGVVSAPSGAAYIADFSNDNIREVTNTGVVATVAGSPVPAAVGLGDGGPAAQAQLSIGGLAPASGGVASFGGAVYVADTGHSIVRKVDGTGLITTAAGAQDAGASFFGDGGPAAKATLNQPEGVAFDSAGDLYIADTRFGLIRRVDAASGNISTVAGVVTSGNPVPGYNGDGAATSTQLSSPASVAVDQVTGDVYIADSGNGLVRKLSNGQITTVAGLATNGQPQEGYSGDGGAATKAELNEPTGLAVDPSGNLFIADTDNNVIREVTLEGVISTVAGSFSAGPGDPAGGGAATAAALNHPLGVAADSGGNLYIADTGNNTLRFVCMDASICASGSLTVQQGSITTLAGSSTGSPGFSGDGGAAASGLMSQPSAVAVDSSGTVFAADSQNGRIRQIADPVSYTAPPPAPRPTPTPTPTPTATPTSTASGEGGDQSPANGNTGADTSGLGQTSGADLLGNRVLGRTGPAAPATAAPATTAVPSPHPSSSPSPAAGSAPGPGGAGAAGLKAPSAPFPWWIAVAILAAALLGASGATIVWRWRRPPAIATGDEISNDSTQPGSGLRKR